MVERLEDMPEGTLGFRISGEVHRADYTDVLEPHLRKALEAFGGLRTLYLIETLAKIEPSALWEDAKLGFDLGVRQHDKWVRSALVTDLEWIVNAMRLFAWVAPGEARVYPVAELEPARAWVAAG